MRWTIVAAVCFLSAAASAAGNGPEGCTQKCTDRLNGCTVGCKGRGCIEKCSSQLESCVLACGDGDWDDKHKAPKGNPGKAPKPPAR